MSTPPHDVSDDLACQHLNARLKWVQHSGRIALALVECSPHVPEDIHVRFDQPVLHRALGITHDIPRSPHVVRHDWLTPFRAIPTTRQGLLGFVVIDANGAVSAAPWEGTLTAARVPLQAFQAMLQKALEEIAPSPQGGRRPRAMSSGAATPDRAPDDSPMGTPADPRRGGAQERPDAPHLDAWD